MKKAEKKSKPAKKTSKGGASPKKTAQPSAAKKPAKKTAKISPKTTVKTSAKSSPKNAKPAAKKPANKKASSGAVKKPAVKKPAPSAKKTAAKKAPAKKPQTKALPKAQAKKPAPKTASAKKPNSAPSAKKAAKQKPAAKKPANKKASSGAVKKPAQKKPAPSIKKAAAKKAPAKPAAKKQTVSQSASAKKASAAAPSAKSNNAKAAPKKPEAKKAAPKKAEAKKIEPKKAESKKVEDKKPAPKKQAKTAANSAGKSEPAIKSARRLSAAEVINLLKIKIPAPAKAPEAKASAPAVRPSAGIYFSMDDLEDYFKARAASKNEDKSARAESSASAKISAKKAVQTRAPAAPKKTLESASISDILGFNPIVQSKSELEEKDVPAKWKKYYRLLIAMRARFEGSPSEKIESVSVNNGGLSHENSTQGMDAADIGSKSFERDMAFSLLSSEQNIISEVNAALERIRNGTYGRCEITGKPIPESRLMAIPFARCTVDGQRQKELENKKAKPGSRSQYAVDLGGDDMPLSEMSDDSGE